MRSQQIAEQVLVAIVQVLVLRQLDRVVARGRVGELEAKDGSLTLLAGRVLGLVDADERVFEAGIVDDHRALRVLDVRDVDRPHDDPAPVEMAEPLVGEDVQGTGEDDGVGRVASQVLAQRGQVDVRGRAKLHFRGTQEPVDEVRISAGPGRPSLEGVVEQVWIVVPAYGHAARSPLSRQRSRRAAPLLFGVGLDVALVEDRPHELEAPLLEVRRLCTLVGVHVTALLELSLDLVAACLGLDVGEQDRPVEHLALDDDVDPMAVGTERRHRVRELPDLLVLGVEDVRAVRLVEHAAHVL